MLRCKGRKGVIANNLNKLICKGASRKKRRPGGGSALIWGWEGEGYRRRTLVARVP